MNLLVSKGRYQYNVIGVIILFTIIYIPITVYLIKKAQSYEYVQYGYIIAAIVLASLFIWLLIKGSKEAKAIDIYEQTLLYKYHWGIKKIIIHPTEITRFGETVYEHNDHIYLQLSDRYLIFPIAATNNDIELLHQLTLWDIKRVDNVSIKTLTKQAEKRNDILLNLFLVVWGLFLTYSIYIYEPHYFSSAELVPISGQLTQKPEIHTSRKGNKWVSFTLSQYPNLRFEVDKLRYKKMQTSGLPYFAKGADIKLWITNTDFHKYIIQDSSLNFFNKHFASDKINTLGVEINNTTLLTFDNFNAARKEDHEFAKQWGWILITALLCTLFRKQLKKRFNPWSIKK